MDSQQEVLVEETDLVMTSWHEAGHSMAGRFTTSPVKTAYPGQAVMRRIEMRLSSSDMT